MKKSKSVIAVTLAVMMAMSVNTASASFLSGLGSKISGAFKQVEQKVKPEKKAQQPVQVDMQGLTGQQQRVLNRLSAGMILVAKSNIALNEALGKNNDQTVQAVNLLQSNKTKDNIENLSKALKKNTNKSSDFDAIANGTNAQKANLKSAMEKANLYRYASYICFGLAVRDGGKLVKDAGSAIKSIGLSNLSQSNQLKTYVSTGNMAKNLYKQTKKGYADYDKKANKAKQLLNPNEVKADDSKVKALAQQALDGGFDF